VRILKNNFSKVSSVTFATEVSDKFFGLFFKKNKVFTEINILVKPLIL
jgi:hypothetical protein